MNNQPRRFLANEYKLELLLNVKKIISAAILKRNIFSNFISVT